jgi:hypothetical protein
MEEKNQNYGNSMFGFATSEVISPFSMEISR